MAQHVIGVIGDRDEARQLLESAGIEVVDDHPNFASDDGSGSADLAARLESESLEEATAQVRQAVLGSADADDGDWQFRPVEPE